MERARRLRTARGERAVRSTPVLADIALYLRFIIVAEEKTLILVFSTFLRDCLQQRLPNWEERNAKGEEFNGNIIYSSFSCFVLRFDFLKKGSNAEF